VHAGRPREQPAVPYVQARSLHQAQILSPTSCANVTCV
jgi:hypothetical protein